ncbi:unnamed protein product [Vitrella brassicaformis CCMP3155]|uniref:Uncharacterized protein n=2 Tax=Vitrella brassicaformis TaxID=1169539 RepID=A0A0G4EE65_VITBC|nr:unnamed protein product [Vitrella brassicaformis CCMP3155]|eukprot:CEL93848.1 unnamed protein product [Vitrella brassicaformis CCMP3155]
MLIRFLHTYYAAQGEAFLPLSSSPSASPSPQAITSPLVLLSRMTPGQLLRLIITTIGAVVILQFLMPLKIRQIPEHEEPNDHHHRLHEATLFAPMTVAGSELRTLLWKVPNVLRASSTPSPSTRPDRRQRTGRSKASKTALKGQNGQTRTRRESTDDAASRQKTASSKQESGTPAVGQADILAPPEPPRNASDAAPAPERPALIRADEALAAGVHSDNDTAVDETGDDIRDGQGSDDVQGIDKGEGEGGSAVADEAGTEGSVAVAA